MKKRIIFLVLPMLLASCSSSKKIETNKEIKELSTQIATSIKGVDECKAYQYEESSSLIDKFGRLTSSHLIEAANYVNKKIDKVKLELESNKINYVVLGQGDKIVKQTPSSGDVITTNDTVYLITNDSNITVPSVVGLSSKVAKSILNNLGIKVKLDGVGYVSTQSVAESTQISDGMEIILTLNPRFSTEGENG